MVNSDLTASSLAAESDEPDPEPPPLPPRENMVDGELGDDGMCTAAPSRDGCPGIR